MANKKAIPYTTILKELGFEHYNDGHYSHPKLPINMFVTVRNREQLMEAVKAIYYQGVRDGERNERETLADSARSFFGSFGIEI